MQSLFFVQIRIPSRFFVIFDIRDGPPLIFCILLFLALCNVRYRENGIIEFLTKGDNNQFDDRSLYAPGQLWLSCNDVVGRVRG